MTIKKLGDAVSRTWPVAVSSYCVEAKHTAEVGRVPAVAVDGAHVHVAGAGSPHIRRLSLANNMFTQLRQRQLWCSRMA